MSALDMKCTLGSEPKRPGWTESVQKRRVRSVMPTATLRRLKYFDPLRTTTNGLRQIHRSTSCKPSSRPELLFFFFFLFKKR